MQARSQRPGGQTPATTGGGKLFEKIDQRSGGQDQATRDKAHEIRGKLAILHRRRRRER